MILKLFKSAKDLTGDKIRNPFFGTYIFVWLIRNWELIYTLIYFDKGTKLTNRLSCIKLFFTDKNVFLELGYNLWITFLVFLLSYILLNLSRLIINFSELKIKPIIKKLVDSKSIVSKERFKLLENQRNDLQQSLENTRDSLSSIENELKDKITQIKAITKKESKERALKLEAKNEINDLNKHIISFEKKEQNNKLINERYRNTIYHFVMSVFIKSGKYIVDFKNLYDENKNKDINKSPFTNKRFKDTLVRLFLIEIDKDDNYSFTPFGHIFGESCTINESKNGVNFDAFKGIDLYIKGVSIEKL